MVLPAQIEGIMLMTDLAKTTAALAALSASATRVVDAYQAAEASLTDSQTALANVDDTVSSQVDAITSTLDAAVPAPVPQQSAEAETLATGESPEDPSAATS
jgi:hypothetical protein